MGLDEVGASALRRHEVVAELGELELAAGGAPQPHCHGDDGGARDHVVCLGAVVLDAGDPADAEPSVADIHQVTRTVILRVRGHQLPGEGLVPRPADHRRPGLDVAGAQPQHHPAVGARPASQGDGGAELPHVHRLPVERQLPASLFPPRRRAAGVQGEGAFAGYGDPRSPADGHVGRHDGRWLAAVVVSGAPERRLRNRDDTPAAATTAAVWEPPHHGEVTPAGRLWKIGHDEHHVVPDREQDRLARGGAQLRAGPHSAAATGAAVVFDDDGGAEGAHPEDLLAGDGEGVKHVVVLAAREVRHGARKAAPRRRWRVVVVGEEILAAEAEDQAAFLVVEHHRIDDPTTSPAAVRGPSHCGGALS